MANLRDRPLRLEQALTRDYINRAEKMREIEGRIGRWTDHPMVSVAAWVGLGILFVYAIMTV